MFLLGLDRVDVVMPAGTLLEGLSLGVDEGDRIGIVGANGAGKTTLLRVLAGAREADEGRVIHTSGVSVGLLAQQDDLDDNASVGAAIVGDRPEYEWAGDERIREILRALAGDLSWDARVGTLSGGQRRRVDLARLLCGDWDVLALDEPTNHLDIAAIAWLAHHLKTRWKPGRGALLVVTHDRWFLDEVAEAMWEVHDRSVRRFEGGFSAYIEARVVRERAERAAEVKRQNALRRELAWLSRGARARATKPKFHVEAVRELVADVPPLRNPVELRRMAMARLGKRVVEMERVSVEFPQGDGRANSVLRGIDWIVGPGDRVGIIGANGAGKTTLLRVLCGELAPTSGRVVVGETVRFAVLSQRLEGMDLWGSERVRDVVGRHSHRVMLDGRDMTPAQLLENLGFTAAELNEPVGDLSGGQRRRLALMLILLEEPNVIVLDEPGNDLDVDMLAALETMLDGWPGTLVMVTHDRYLMERTCDDVFALMDGGLRHLPGGVDEYLRLVGAGATPGRGDGGMTPGRGGTTRGQSVAARRRELQKEVRSLERRCETAAERQAAARAALEAVDPADYEALMAAQAELDALIAAAAELDDAWLEAAEALESLDT